MELEWKNEGSPDVRDTVETKEGAACIKVKNPKWAQKAAGKKFPGKMEKKETQGNEQENQGNKWDGKKIGRDLIQSCGMKEC